MTYRRVHRDLLPELRTLLTGETWPFHGVPRPTPDEIDRRAEEGAYWGENVESYLLHEEELGEEELGEEELGGEGKRVGILRLFDLEDPTAVFDLRLIATARGQGRGKAAVRWLGAHLFATHPHLIRIEAHTRVDNSPMRAVLRACGYVREAYHRQAWPQEGTVYDAVGYALLRSDWESGSITPVPPDP